MKYGKCNYQFPDIYPHTPFMPLLALELTLACYLTTPLPAALVWGKESATLPAVSEDPL